jgi:DNA-directed RNA polymerase subunit omega
MIVKPTVSELLEEIGDNRYSLVIMTAKRARQLADGDPARVKAKDRSLVTVAAKEIAAGQVKKLEDENVEE